MVVINATVANTGAVAGTEVVQAYAHDPLAQSLVVRFWKRLVGFARVTLQPGARQTVSMTVAADDLATFDDRMRLRVEAGRFTFSVGNSSATDTAQAAAEVEPALADAATACLRNTFPGV